MPSVANNTSPAKAGKKDKKTIKKKSAKPKVAAELKPYLECADVGHIELVGNYIDLQGIPEKQSSNKPKKHPKALESKECEFGRLPWRLSLVHYFRTEEKDGKPTTTHYLKATMTCPKILEENSGKWSARVSGTLHMKKWPEKQGIELEEGEGSKKKGSKKNKRQRQKQKPKELKESFSYEFNSMCRSYKFKTEFPLPIQGSAFSGPSGMDSPYIFNRQFKFHLDFLLHETDLSLFPATAIDFRKRSPQRTVSITVKGKKFYVNKEFLALHSAFVERLFTSEGFIESQKQQATLVEISPVVFHEFLRLLYEPLRKVEVRFINGLLEMARIYVIPLLTGLCEQRLLRMRYDDAELTLEQRLNLADEFGLLELKASIISRNDPQELLKFEGLLEDTKAMLKRKLAMKKQDEAEEEKMEVDQKQEKEKPSSSNTIDSTIRRGLASLRVALGRGHARRGVHTRGAHNAP